MLRCAHKSLLLDLARQHARDLSASLQLTKAVRGPLHCDVQAIEQRLQLAKDAVRDLEAEPARAAA